MKKCLAVTASLFLVILLQGSLFAASPTKSVSVENTPDVNVVGMPPLELSTTTDLGVVVNNEPTVDARQLGTWQVEVTNQPGLTETEYISIVFFETLAPGASISPTPSYVVPQDKILIIDHITHRASYNHDSTSFPYTPVLTYFNSRYDVFPDERFTNESITPTAYRDYASKAVKLYVPTGNVLLISYPTNYNDGHVTSVMTLSCRLIDAP